MISEIVATQISKPTFSHPCSKFLATAKAGLTHYDSFRDGGSHILEDRECNSLFVTMDRSCKLYFKRDNILQLRTSSSLVDYQLPCPPLTEQGSLESLELVTLVSSVLITSDFAFLPSVVLYFHSLTALPASSSSWWSIGLEDDIISASYLWVRQWLCRPILDLQSRAQSGHWKFAFCRWDRGC